MWRGWKACSCQVVIGNGIGNDRRILIHLVQELSERGILLGWDTRFESYRVLYDAICGCWACIICAIHIHGFGLGRFVIDLVVNRGIQVVICVHDCIRRLACAI